MAYKKVNEDSLTSLANAIRTKAGVSGAMTFPAGFLSTINSIAGATFAQLNNQATGAQIVANYSAYTHDGTVVNGQIANRQIYCSGGPVNMMDEASYEEIIDTTGMGNDGVRFEYEFPSGYYPSGHKSAVYAYRINETLDQFPKTFTPPSTGTNPNVYSPPVWFYESFTIDALDGDIYRVANGTVADGAVIQCGFVPMGVFICQSSAYNGMTSPGRRLAMWYFVDEEDLYHDESLKITSVGSSKVSVGAGGSSITIDTQNKTVSFNNNASGGTFQYVVWGR